MIAKTLIDLNLYRSDFGMLVIASAVFNDLFGWIIFAAILALLGGSPGGLATLYWAVPMVLISELPSIDTSEITRLARHPMNSRQRAYSPRKVVRQSSADRMFCMVRLCQGFAMSLPRRLAAAPTWRRRYCVKVRRLA